MLSHEKVKEIIANKLGISAIEIQENDSGVDQYVWIITTSDSIHEKIVLKKPKQERYLLIIREVLACKILKEIFSR